MVPAESTPVATPQGYLTLEDIKRRAPVPLAANCEASLWDMGDGIACLELTTKDNVITPDVVKIIGDAIKLGTGKRLKGLVIGNDSDTFSAGADLRLLREAAQPSQSNWTQISDAIKTGQRAMQGLKYSPFPVVSALAGKALGGGCELLLHSDAIQAHALSFPGLVEPAVGLVPAWGGCTQMLMRQSFPVVRHIPTVFQNIARCRVASSLDEASEMKILRATDGVSMNRSRLLADAKTRCLQMAKDYSPPRPQTVHLPGAVLKRIIDSKADALRAQGQNNRPRRGRLQSILHRPLRREYQYDLLAQRAAIARPRARRFHGADQDRSNIQAHRPYGAIRQAVQGAARARKGARNRFALNRKRCQEPFRSEIACGGSASTGNSELALSEVRDAPEYVVVAGRGVIASDLRFLERDARPRRGHQARRLLPPRSCHPGHLGRRWPDSTQASYW